MTREQAQAEFDELKAQLKGVPNVNRQFKRKTIRDAKKAIWNKYKIHLE